MAVRPLLELAVNKTAVFKRGRGQAVCLPSEFGFPEHVKRVRVRAVGLDRVISPFGHSWDNFFNPAPNTPLVSEDFMPERVDPTAEAWSGL
jgi:antitoxin VapB